MSAKRLTALNVVGARPNFMKIAPIHRAMVADGRVDPVLVHTGQHYDDNMSQVFFEEFGLPSPQVELRVGSGSHAEQTARVMLALEPVVSDVRPDVVVVVGDVNSTLAAALTATKLGVPVAHVEAGLRSFDREMPEEINRLVTDAIADVLFAPSGDAVEHLEREGVNPSKIHMVGNVMIDTLDALAPRVRSSTAVQGLGLEPGRYIVVTLHRPSNVDRPADLRETVDVLTAATAHGQVVFVAHPRTAEALRKAGMDPGSIGVRMLEPVGYVDFVSLVSSAGAVLTDSGGIQEETTVLGVPCLTMRTTTERPVTVTLGTNRLIARDADVVAEALGDALAAPRRPVRPPGWDGKAAERVVQVLTRDL